MLSKCIKTSYFQGEELQKERDSEKKKEDKMVLVQNVIAVSLRFMHANSLL